MVGLPEINDYIVNELRQDVQNFEGIIFFLLKLFLVKTGINTPRIHII